MTEVMAPKQVRLNVLAVGALVVGILWIVGIGSLLAVVLGSIARGQIDRSEGAQTGRGIATAAIVVGSVGIVVTVALTLLLSFGSATGTG